MKRKIIEIDESKCNGCGVCIPDCPEGALQIIDGKARLVSDLFCDGLGACIKTCPRDAMRTVEREAEAYDEAKVMANVVRQGENVIIAHLKHLKEHGETTFLAEALKYLKDQNLPIPIIEDKPVFSGCPGMIQKEIIREPVSDTSQVKQASQLQQWPTQLHLIQPGAGYFHNSDLLICADCVPFAYGNFHNELLANKKIVHLCPKLDEGIDRYIDKLAELIRVADLKSITIARMEVPCCGGIEHIIAEAQKKANSNYEVKVVVISIDGKII